MTSGADARADAAAFDFLDLLQADLAAEQRRPLAEYLTRFPEFQERIAREYLAATADASRTPSDMPAANGSAGDLFGNYRLIRLLGRGGQGAVYLSEDTRLHRSVALKILDARVSGIGTAQVERLRREAAALARLDHPGVCAIYEADMNGERPFLAMRYVPGETLAARVTKAATSQQPEDEMLSRLPSSTAEIARVLHFFERAAYALEAAHEAGLVHRDVKPANIMIDRDGMPVMLDFGLARMAEDAGLSLTLTGEVFGTLAYMSPEQLTGEGDLDARTDIYSLGVTLYECLTLQLPFRKETRQVLDREIRAGAPRSPLAFNPALSRDLCIVLATAMERDRSRRYATARAFADDLANVAGRRPINARSAGVWLRLWRWQQRHPVLAATATLLLLLLVVMSWSVWQLKKSNRRLVTWQHVTGLVQSSEDRPAEALAKLVDVARGEELPQIREALHTVLLRDHEAWRETLAPDEPMHERATPWDTETLWGNLIADPTADRFFAGSTWGYVYARDIATGRVSACFRAHDSMVTAIALSLDRRMLVTASYTGELRLWSVGDLGARGPIATMRFEGRVSQCAFGPQGDQLAIAYDSKPGTEPSAKISVIGLDSNGAPSSSAPTVLEGHRGQINQLMFSPNGRQLVSLGEVPNWRGTTNQQLFLWDVASGAQLIALDAHTLESDISSACWADEGALAVTLQQGALRVYSDGDWAHFREHKFAATAIMWVGAIPGSNDLWLSAMDGVWLVQTKSMDTRHVFDSSIDRAFQTAVFSPDGKYAAVAVRDSSLRVIETRTWRQVANLRQHQGYVNDCLWSGDGRRLVSIDHGRLHGWNFLARPYIAELLGHVGRVLAIDFAADSNSLVTAGEDGTVRLWDRANAMQTDLVQLDAPRKSARFSPSGRYVVSVGETAVAHVVKCADPTHVTELVGHTNHVTDAWITAIEGTERAVTISDDGSARVWDLDTGFCLRIFSGNTGPLRYGAIDARRNWLGCGGEDTQHVHVFDLRSGMEVQDLVAPPDPPHILGMQGRVRGIRFLPKSGRLAVSAEDSPVTLWDPSASWTRNEVGISGSTGWLASDSDERWMAIGEYSLGRLVWVSGDLKQRERYEDRDPTSWISRIAVRAQGDIGLVACRDGSVWLYDWQRRDRYSVLRADNGAVLDADFSPDGKWIAAAYRDGTARVWPVEPMPAAESYLIPSLR